jgi:hypothetical protein
MLGSRFVFGSAWPVNLHAPESSNDPRKHPMTQLNPDFEALKSITRLSWLLNFEAIATVANDEDALRIARVPG